MPEDCQDPDATAQLQPLASADAQELIRDEEKARKNIRRVGTYWNKPPLKIYADNFGFGVNGYQCMIDYLDEKDYGGDPSKKVRLPLLEDRCLDSYSSKKPFRFYENYEIDDFIDKGEQIRSNIRHGDVATPGNVLHRTHTNWSMTKKYVQLVKNSHVIDYRKLRQERELESRGVIVPHNLKSAGATFLLESMDPFNLTLHKAHDNLDHAIFMNARRERLTGIGEQFDGVVTQLSEGTEDLNRRAIKEMSGRNRKKITPYDDAQSLEEVAMISEDLAARNRLRRKLEFQALEDGVDSIMRYDKSRNRVCNNLRALDDTVVNMHNEVSAMRRRHQQERGCDDDISVEVLRAQAKNKARRVLNLDVADEDVDDPELARLRMKRRQTYEPLDDPAVTPFRKYRSQPDVVSDVHSRVLQRAGEIAGQTSTHRHVNNRARYINIYVPRHNTADPNLIVGPSRTEMNIDHMAKTLAAKGRIQRRYDVDDEADLPVSGLNTHAYKQYVKREAQKPVDQVPSNSLRVRDAVCRARERNALLGR